ncbi:MAG: universal stress protein [Oceanococcaceae bacterium]
MNHTPKVLACVDQSHFADDVADYAAWAAGRLDAPLEFLHVIDRQAEIPAASDHSGAIGFDAQEVLLEELSSQDEARSRAAREQGRVFLNRLRERALSAGLTAADVRQRYGVLADTLSEQEKDTALFVLGRRGHSAETTQRDLGRNVESVVRRLRKPILAVTENFRAPRRALLAFDGRRITRAGVRLIAQSPLFRGMDVHLVMSGKPRADGKKQLAWARTTLADAGFDAPTQLIEGDAERVILRYAQEQSVDLLIMGAYSHSPLRGLLMGSTTSDLLRAATVPALLLR